MNYKTRPKRTINITEYHSESAFKKGDTTERYLQRKRAEELEQQHQNAVKRTFNQELIVAQRKKFKISAAILLIILLINVIVSISMLCTTANTLAAPAFWINTVIGLLVFRLNKGLIDYYNSNKYAF